MQALHCEDALGAEHPCGEGSAARVHAREAPRGDRYCLPQIPEQHPAMREHRREEPVRVPHRARPRRGWGAGKGEERRENEEIGERKERERGGEGQEERKGGGRGERR